MKKLLLCGAVAATLVPAAPAAAAKATPCEAIGMASVVSKIKTKGIACDDARVLIRSVEAHAAQCKPYRQQTIAPWRECVVTPALSVGTRNFFCRSHYEAHGDNKRWWRTTCKSFVGDAVRWRRDGNAP